mmetsp:Transcript_10651/g.45401  ORF Transcript_10651/g.45401 Transcript_10651/m.45401 type:complete len:229 (-) Transcript_10651:994-1680(-)
MHGHAHFARREVERVHVPHPPEHALDNRVALPELHGVRPRRRQNRQVVRVHHLRRVPRLRHGFHRRPFFRVLPERLLRQPLRRRHRVRVPRDDVPEQETVRVTSLQHHGGRRRAHHQIIRLRHEHVRTPPRVGRRRPRRDGARAVLHRVIAPVVAFRVRRVYADRGDLAHELVVPRAVQDAREVHQRGPRLFLSFEPRLIKHARLPIHVRLAVGRDHGGDTRRREGNI